jgi:catechol 2,3-dioxygenase-like lactoylglutathione lyase family enzyme
MAISASRIFHVNSNCIDLEQSLTFYRDLLGLKQNTHPIPSILQRGDAFGLEQVLWDAWMLQSDLGNDGLSLDLLEWKVPKPAGRPPTEINETGFHHLTFAVPDLQACVDRLRDAGVTIVGGPIDMDLGNGSSIAMAMVKDPDGVPLQLIGGRDTRISHVVVNTRDLDTSVAYYRDVMGLDVLRTVGAVRQSGALYGLDTEVECRSAMLRDRGSKFMVELVEWLDPLPAPGTDRVRAANDVGLFRMAFSTTDCHGDEAIVRAAGSVPFAPTGTLSVGDHLPLLYVLFWPGPNGECLELIQTGAPRESLPR